MNKSLDNSIPVCKEDTILCNELVKVFLGKDSGCDDNYSFRSDDIESILATFPTKAIRKTNSGHYIMFDSDTGFRVYLFFDYSYADEFFKLDLQL